MSKKQRDVEAKLYKMSQKIKQYIRTVKQMPQLIQGITILFLIFGVLISIITFLPDDLRVTEVATSELWKTGDAFLLLLLGITMIIISLGFLHKTIWSRPLFLIPLISIYIYESKGSQILGCNPLIESALSIIAVIFMIWYFYFKSEVKQFFRQTNKIE